MLKNKKGFTLIEVAVVLVILGILAAITIPNVGGWVEDANNRKILTEAKSAVKTTEGLIAKLYAKGDNVGYKVSPSTINKESGLKGDVVSRSVEISYPKDNELLHLTYSNYGDYVTYCAYPYGSGADACDIPTHTEHYNFIEGEGYDPVEEDTTTEDGIDDGDDNGSDDGDDSGGGEGDGDGDGDPTEPVVTPPSEGFTVIGVDGEELFVPSDTFENELSKYKKSGDGRTISNEVFYLDGSYYYLRNGQYFGYGLDMDGVRDKINNGLNNQFFKIHTDKTYRLSDYTSRLNNENNVLKAGSIVYKTESDGKGYYYILLPYGQIGKNEEYVKKWQWTVFPLNY